MPQTNRRGRGSRSEDCVLYTVKGMEECRHAVRLLNRRGIWFHRCDITNIKGKKLAPTVAARFGIVLVGLDEIRQFLKRPDARIILARR